MKRIVLIAKPFAIYQKLLVYENGNKIDGIEISHKELGNALFELTDKYQIDRVDLTGPKQYISGLAKQFETLELNKYNKNSITFNII